MKNILYGILFFLLCFVFIFLLISHVGVATYRAFPFFPTQAPTVPADPPPTPPIPAKKLIPDETSSSIKAYVVRQAKTYGINPDLAVCIVSHESQWIPTKLGPETKGVSQGLWQIYSLDHPEITRAQTFDVEWSTTWSLTQIRAGRIEWWSTFDQYCSSTPIFL